MVQGQNSFRYNNNIDLRVVGVAAFSSQPKNIGKMFLMYTRVTYSVYIMNQLMRVLPLFRYCYTAATTTYAVGMRVTEGDTVVVYQAPLL